MPAGNALILVIEDEPSIRRFLHTSLSGEGYRVVQADTAERALRQASQQTPDLIILDLGLPDLDGQEVLRKLRGWSTVPIIVLSARHQEEQKISALDSGADDYLTKPFSTGELLARIRVALRHATRIDGDSVFRCGELMVDLDARRVLVGNHEVHLTPLEYKLLCTLVLNAGKVLTHRFLLKEVWGPHHTEETPYLRVFMASLRRKIEADPAQPVYLLTEQGVGYRLHVE
jgi:two-component system, OmpR family, KDP operon response regulator KdpE